MPALILFLLLCCCPMACLAGQGDVCPHYWSEGGQAYYGEHEGDVPGQGARLLGTAHPEQLHPLSPCRSRPGQNLACPGRDEPACTGPYAGDGKQVFFRGEPVAGADARSFQVDVIGVRAPAYLSTMVDVPLIPYAPLPQPQPNYSRDRHAIYFENMRLSTRVAAFHLLRSRDGSRTGYASDGRQVFYGAHVLPNGRTTLFAGSAYAAIDSRLYWAGLPVSGAQAASFRTWAWEMGKDRAQVYFHDHAIEGADPASFTADGLPGEFHDALQVYVWDKPIPDLHLATMRRVGLYIVDAGAVWWVNRGQPGGVERMERFDAATFGSDGRWDWDAHGVWCNKQPLAGVDAVHFHFVDGIAQDTHRQFSGFSCEPLCHLGAARAGDEKLPLCQ